MLLYYLESTLFLPLLLGEGGGEVIRHENTTRTDLILTFS